jgi:hypothetical protein
MLNVEGNNARRAKPLHNTKFYRTTGEIECASSRPRLVSKMWTTTAVAMVDAKRLNAGRMKPVRGWLHL